MGNLFAKKKEDEDSLMLDYFSTPTPYPSTTTEESRKTSLELSSYPRTTPLPDRIPHPRKPRVSQAYIDYQNQRHRNDYYYNKHRVPFGHPRYAVRHPSEQHLPVDRFGERAVYGADRKGRAIFGPVYWTQFEKDWSQIGNQYKMPVNPQRPILQIEENFLNAHKFYIEATLGAGGFGTVFRVRADQLVKDNNNQFIRVRLAMKITSLVKFQRGNRSLHQAVSLLLRESDLHSQLIHPNIVKTEHVFHITDQVSRFSQPIRLCHFLELCDGDLKLMINSMPNHRMSEAHARLWLSHIASGLKYLHDNRVAHFDIKPGNILFKRTPHMTFKLSDFGLSHKYAPHVLMLLDDSIGTAKYMAPEMKIQPKQIMQAKPTDIYSLGLVLAQSLDGRLTNNAILDAIAAGNTVQLTFSNGVVSLIAEMTDPDPANRPTIDEVLNSPWVTSP